MWKGWKVLTILHGSPEGDEKKNAGVGTHGVAVAERCSVETFSCSSQLCCMSQCCSVCAGASAPSLLYICSPSHDAPPTCASGAAPACDPEGVQKLWHIPGIFDTTEPPCGAAATCWVRPAVCLLRWREKHFDSEMMCGAISLLKWESPKM